MRNLKKEKSSIHTKWGFQLRDRVPAKLKFVDENFRAVAERREEDWGLREGWRLSQRE